MIERLRWAGFLIDCDLRLVWVSPDVQRFAGSATPEELGCGLHVLEAMSRDSWRRIVTPESRARVWGDLGPALVGEGMARGIETDVVPASLRALLPDIEARPFTRPVATSFDYLEPGGDDDLPPYRVNVLATPLRDGDGAFLGVLVLGYMSVRPGLVTLLSRGDESMYERMAKLVEPSAHEAAVLFCDLEDSTELARELPAREYFRFIRNLWTEIDALVARHHGIVGKHAGDGGSAFFLVDDLGSASRAASAAVRTADEIHRRAGARPMRVGIHWGSSLYIGQLVPGGRLEVAALGDAVNECARLQESAVSRQTLASKALVERLSPDDAAGLGLDLGKLRFTPLSSVPGASEKAIASAGAVAVIPLEVAAEET